MSDPGVVELVLALVEHFEALGIGLHEPVLDAVVHHLHVMARARWAEMQPAAGADRVAADRARLGGQHVEDRREPPDAFLGTADHHAVSDFEAPHAPRDADVDVFDSVAAQLARTALVVRPA